MNKCNKNYFQKQPLKLSPLLFQMYILSNSFCYLSWVFCSVFHPWRKAAFWCVCVQGLCMCALVAACQGRAGLPVAVIAAQAEPSADPLVSVPLSLALPPGPSPSNQAPSPRLLLWSRSVLLTFCHLPFHYPLNSPSLSWWLMLVCLFQILLMFDTLPPPVRCVLITPLTPAFTHCLPAL